MLRDGNDHSIYFVNATFKDYALVSTTDTMDVGDRVFIIGNPGGETAIYREGVVASIRPDEDAPHSGGLLGVLFGIAQMRTITLIDMNIFPGDSGSAIFNDKGQVVGVISVCAIQTQHFDDKEKTVWTFGLAGALPLAFTPKALLGAQTWKPGDPNVQ